ncbi:MAG: pilus assembly PilX N-terminal domain-containing protein [bacterium]|nr:pilus assembly PilX N-terminal domain-containing protein [bacterium]
MKKNSGQAAIFVLLVMLLGLTVGLSVMSRTLQDLKSTTTSDQSSRAFSAAEAGIESALATADLSTIDYYHPGTITINGVQTKYFATPKATQYMMTVSKDDVTQIDLRTGFTGGTVKIYWKDPDPPRTNCVADDTGMAALEISVYKQSPSDVYGVDKYAYNAYGCSLAGNSFSNGLLGGNVGGIIYKSSTSPLILTTDAKLIRIRPIYNSADIAISGVPTQGYDIKSTGTVNGIARAVQITKTKPSLPPLFDYVLFGGSGNVLQ